MVAPMIRDSFEEADDLGESLTLIRPKSLEVVAHRKSESEISSEQRKHEALASQMSLFDPTTKPLKTCPMAFKANWSDNGGKHRSHECDDWETSAAYNRFERMYGSDEAIRILKQKYEDEYFNAGLLLGFSTHSRRNVENGMKNQWLLVGMIRVDAQLQGNLF